MRKTPLPRLSFFRSNAAQSQRGLNVETRAAAPASPRACPPEQLAFGGFERLEPPAWFRKMVKRGDSPEKVLQALRARVLKGGDLHVAMMIVNGIGRLPGGSALVRKMVTQDLISKLARRASNAR